MAETTKEKFVTDFALITPLAAEYAEASDPRERTLVQCRTSYQAVGHLEGEPRNQTAIDFAELVSVDMAAITYPTNPDLAARMAKTSVQQGGQALSHTAILQRSMAYALASVVGTPTPDSIMIANRLAASTKKGAADEKKRILAEGSDVYGDDLSKFEKAVDASLDAIKKANAPKAPTGPKPMEFDLEVLRQALTWAAKNPAAFDDAGDDLKAELVAGARAVVKFASK